MQYLNSLIYIFLTLIIEHKLQPSLQSPLFLTHSQILNQAFIPSSSPQSLPCQFLTLDSSLPLLFYSLPLGHLLTSPHLSITPVQLAFPHLPPPLHSHPASRRCPLLPFIIFIITGVRDFLLPVLLCV